MRFKMKRKTMSKILFLVVFIFASCNKKQSNQLIKQKETQEENREQIIIKEVPFISEQGYLNIDISKIYNKGGNVIFYSIEDTTKLSFVDKNVYINEKKI